MVWPEVWLDIDASAWDNHFWSFVPPRPYFNNLVILRAYIYPFFRLRIDHNLLNFYALCSSLNFSPISTTPTQRAKYEIYYVLFDCKGLIVKRKHLLLAFRRMKVPWCLDRTPRFSILKMIFSILQFFSKTQLFFNCVFIFTYLFIFFSYCHLLFWYVYKKNFFIFVTNKNICNYCSCMF